MNTTHVPPDHESLVAALRLIARPLDGRELDLTDVDRIPPEVLVGMLDVAVDEVAWQLCKGKGKSRRFQIVLGYKQYLGRSGQDMESLMPFFQRRLERLVADMKSPPATNLE